MADAVDLGFMQQAINASKNSPPRANCFRVGAVLVNKHRQLISSGATLELGEGWHAEAVAIKKARDAKFTVYGGTIYSSLEPCSVRKSGGKDCVSLLIESGIAQVFYAMAEPPIFVTGIGDSKLKASGIKVEKISELEEAVKKGERVKVDYVPLACE
jgi:pyrimidine deaminase RibD-like protein